MKADRYPLARAALERLLQGFSPSSQTTTPLSSFAIGPAVLRQPPARTELAAPPAPLEAPGTPRTEELLGELVDMVFVSADDERGSGHHEVHLVFKAEVWGGLHLKLVKLPDGMQATFVVEDAAARRAVASHIDDLVEHLRGRGFTITRHQVEVATP